MSNVRNIQYIEKPYFVHEHRIYNREPYKIIWDGSNIIYEFKWPGGYPIDIKIKDTYIYITKEELIKALEK